MAGSVNKVILVGNVGKTPDIRKMPSGDVVANFSIATSEVWTDRNTGEKKERTEWHNVVVFNKGLVSVVERYVDRGTKLYIEGQLQTRKWQDKDGKDRYTTEVVLQAYRSELHILSSRGNDGAPLYSSSDSQYDSSSEHSNYENDIDDEIPF